MQDTGLTITVKTAGIPEAQAKLKELNATMTKMTVNQNGTVTATGKQTSALNNQASATDRVTQSTDRASRSQGNYFAHIAKTTIQSALINKLFLEFVDVSGQAIKQVDLMNNFPATMASLGQSTQDSTEAFKILSDYVGQVGGNLGDAASMVTRFTGVTGNVKSSVAIFSALNNALIAGDSSLEEQRNAATQFAQAFERGKPDMREWLSLTQNMSNQLSIVAKEMGYVNANELGEALRTGEESMASFTTELTKLATGTGPIAEQAMARMSGMQFAFNVLKNTLVQSLAAIINAFGRSSIVSFFTLLTDVVKVLTSWIIVLINTFTSLFNVISRLFGGPQLGKITGDVANNISKGAGAADDLGDGLKGAKKDAKELNKSLAGFDKMNVLPDKTSGKSKDDGGAGAAGFDAGQVGALEGVFDGLGGDIKEASIWAKILAGILAGLAANSLISKIFGVNPLKMFGKSVYKHAILPLYTFARNAAVTAAKAAGTFATSLGKGLAGKGSGGSGILGTAAAYGTKIGLAIRAGILTGVGAISTGVAVALTAVGGAIVASLAWIGTAVAGIFIGAAAAATLPLWAVVAIGAVIVAAIVALFIVIWQNWEAIWGWISAAFVAFWDFLVATWNTLYDIFKGPVQFIWDFVSSVFILIVAIVATALEAIFKLLVATVKIIYDVLAAIAGWVFENVIKPVANFFKSLWDGVVAAVTTAWNWIFEKVLRPIGGWINSNVIQPVLKFFKGLWNSVSGFVSGFVASVKSFLSPITSWIKINIIDRIANFFSGLWNGIKGGLSGMMNGLRSIFGGFSNIFKTPLNGIIDLLNGMFRKLNQTVKVPDWVPGLGGKSANFPMIPRLARGGIVEQATLAMVGEAGAEAVVPLENNLEWIDMLADKINSNGGGSQPVQLTVQIGEERIATKVIDLINGKSYLSGRSKIVV